MPQLAACFWVSREIDEGGGELTAYITEEQVDALLRGYPKMIRLAMPALTCYIVKAVLGRVEQDLLDWFGKMLGVKVDPPT